jgi:transcriptional regulator with XRE-family HTH domain
MKRVLKLRLERGLSRSRLSVLSGVNLTSLYEFETGKRRPYPKAARELAAALGWTGDPEELFAEVSE